MSKLKLKGPWKPGRLKRTQNIMHAYIEAAKALFPDRFTPDCCLNGTRIFIESMAMFGVKAEPMVVELFVLNPRWTQKIVETGGWPVSDADAQAWIADGAWAIGVGGGEVGELPDESGGWPHHLIGACGGYLIESALFSANRPERDLELPWALGIKEPDGFRANDVRAMFEFASGATLVYDYKPNETNYLDVPGYQMSPHNAAIVAETVNLMRLNLGKSATISIPDVDAVQRK